MKNYNMILIERLQKYQLYHQTKFISMNILLVKIYYHLITSKQLNKLNLLILLREKLLKNNLKSRKKQIDALADLKPKEIKPRESKPIKYGDYFIDGLAKIRES